MLKCNSKPNIYTRVADQIIAALEEGMEGQLDSESGITWRALEDYADDLFPCETEA